MDERKYGEVKTKKNFFPKDAINIVEKGTVSIIISQCRTSDRTKSILDDAGITLYEGVESEKVEYLLEKLENEEVEKEGELKE